jgi:hypothetical protein
MTLAAQAYSAFQADNPENAEFNDSLIFWREQDDVRGYLEDVFVALEVVQGIHFVKVEIEEDESRFPPELTFNDIEPSRLNLARVHFVLDDPDAEDPAERQKPVTLSIFLPKLIDGLFYELNGSLYYPILQVVDRGTYVTKKTFTLKTLLMPLMFRRDEVVELEDLGGSGDRYREMLFVLDLFRYRISALTYFLASKGLPGTLAFMDPSGEIQLVDRSDADAAAAESPGHYRVHAVGGASGVCVAARAAWVAENPRYRGSLMASIAHALEGAQRRAIDEDDRLAWRRRLGRHFTSNASGHEEKADKILVSLERILDRRTQKNLAHVAPEDKADVYCIMRWMMRDYEELSRIDGMDLLHKRIRLSEYIIHSLLLKFSEGTYRLLNIKSVNYKQLFSVFRPFLTTADGGRTRPQANFVIRRLITNELLRYGNLVNSFDLLPALRFTSRGPQSSRTDVSVRFRGHHSSYVGRVGLTAASASDPGMSGTLVPFAKTDGQFFV